MAVQQPLNTAVTSGAALGKNSGGGGLMDSLAPKGLAGASPLKDHENLNPTGLTNLTTGSGSFSTGIFGKGPTFMETLLQGTTKEGFSNIPAIQPGNTADAHSTSSMAAEGARSAGMQPAGNFNTRDLGNITPSVGGMNVQEPDLTKYQR